MTIRRRNQFLIPAVLLTAAIVLTLPIFYLGMPAGNDLPQHFRFVYTFYEAIQNGQIYPAWSGNTNLGFGDVGIRFYPPLAYYVVVLFRCLTESWATALSLAICFWFFIGGLGIFLLARESFSERASITAALVFMAMPYHVNQVYNAGLFAEFAGLAILPYCFLFVRRTISTAGILDVAALSVAYTLLILAHLPLALIGSFALLIYAVAMLEKKSLGKAVLKLSSAVALALGASAFYWVRMISELSFVNHSGPEFTQSAYDFRLNFLGAIFFLPSAEYGETSLWFTDSLFAITLAMIVPALIIFYLSNKKDQRGPITPMLPVLTVAVLVATPLSSWLWENIDLLRKVQFPWRFLGLISLAGSVIVAAGVEGLPSIFKSKLRPVGLIAVGLIIAGIVFTGAQVMRAANYSSSRAEFDDNFEVYRTDQSYECWWPVWADRHAFTNREKVSSPSRRVEPGEWKDDDRAFVVKAGDETRIRIGTFYYPLWQATVNGENTAVTAAKDGTMEIALGPQVSEVHLFFAEPRYYAVARYTSIFVWILLAASLITGCMLSTRRRTLA